jgi:microcystin-dependent protein
MSDPFLAEIRMVGFSFAPRGWAFCDGQLLPINQNEALFSLLGTIYGGDGRTTFALPDLRGRTPIHFGNGYTQGRKDGRETHTLDTSQMPEHSHAINASTESSSSDPAGQFPGRGAVDMYGAPANLQPMGDGTIVSAGAGQGHENMQPYLAVYFCIALQGVFPSRD